MKQRNAIIPIILLFCSSLTFGQRDSHGDKQTYKLNMAAQHILFSYVDSVDRTELVEGAIKGMLKNLDPHSKYLTPEEVAQSREQLQGNFKGVGIEFNIIDDTLRVVRILEGGPSFKAGLKPGDKILKVNEDTIAGIGLTNEYVYKNLRGPRGSEVVLTIKRRNIAGNLIFNIIRDNIPIFSIDAAFMVKEDIGYIKIARFAGSTHREFMEAVKKLKKQGMKTLILDLQGNGGGYLNAAISITNQFLSKDKLIVYTEGINSRKKEHHAFSKGLLEKQNLVVLIDEGSASASEIVSGALQDWDRAVLVGRRTFGKGLVQRPFNLPDGSELRLTVSRYYTPAGRSIQKSYANGNGEYEKEVFKRITSGELFNDTAYHATDSLKYSTLENGRTVYGGGGIFPDVFTPLDTTAITEFHRKILSQGIMNRFAFDYVDKKRNALNKAYPSFESYKKAFSINDSLFNKLVVEATEEKVEAETLSPEAKELISLQLKAIIARYVFEPQCFYQIMKEEDDAFNKAIEILSSKKSYKHYLEK